MKFKKSTNTIKQFLDQWSVRLTQDRSITIEMTPAQLVNWILLTAQYDKTATFMGLPIKIYEEDTSQQ